jgi:hypothetical protein
MEPETDDNLITWGWADHVIQVRPSTFEGMMEQSLRGRDRSEVSQQQLERMEQRAREQLAEGQRVPMIRVTTLQPLPVVRVVPFNEYQRNRYYR